MNSILKTLLTGTNGNKKRDEMLDQLLSWMTQINAPMPSEANPDYSIEII